jgi:hypothetical protein
MSLRSNKIEEITVYLNFCSFLWKDPDSRGPKHRVAFKYVPELIFGAVNLSERPLFFILHGLDTRGGADPNRR